ncbi:DUF1116 domain-containing protein [Escherichia coli]
MSQSLFSQPLNVINVGIAMFSDDLKKQHVEVTQLDWTPPGQGNMQVVQALDNIADSPLADKIAAANQQALERIIQSHPVLIGFDQAINVVPGMTPKTILHAGPPITWEKMCGAMKGAVTGALVFEGLAKDLDEAAELAASGEITFSPCHEHDCVGSMAGVTSASMFMHIVKKQNLRQHRLHQYERADGEDFAYGSQRSERDRPPQLDARCAGANAARRDENYRRD